MVRRGGWLAVLETDSLHEVLLPWSADLELAIRHAELEAYCARTRRPEKRYLARRLEAFMLRAARLACGAKPIRSTVANRWGGRKASIFAVTCFACAD